MFPTKLFLFCIGMFHSQQCQVLHAICFSAPCFLALNMVRTDFVPIDFNEVQINIQNL